MGAHPNPEEPPAKQIEGDAPTPKSAVILAVDRDPHVRALLEHFLTEAGCSVEFAPDGSAAVDRALELRPDIVITEVLLPGLDGLQLCMRLKRTPALHATRVLIFSLLSAAEQARAAGADAFVRKPLSEARLVDAVRNLLVADSKLELGESA